MKIKQYEIWIADLNPRFGTETGKTRPVVIVQTDLLNKRFIFQHKFNSGQQRDLYRGTFLFSKKDTHFLCKKGQPM